MEGAQCEFEVIAANDLVIKWMAALLVMIVLGCVFPGMIDLKVLFSQKYRNILT